jgi:hypothetical protein
MPSVVTINRPDVITLIEEVAAKMTGGNKTEAVALAMRKLLEQEERTGSPFNFRRGSVVTDKDFDLVHASSGWEDHDPEYGL